MISISTAHNEARLEATKTFIDTGTGNGTVAIYGGTRPTNGAAAGSPVLVEIELSKPCGTVATGLLTLVSTDTPMIANTGAPTWARVLNGNGDHVLDCDAGGPGSTTEIVVSESTLYQGGQVTLTSAVLG